MKDFKFFKGTLNMIDDDVRATASFNDDTADGHVYRRMLYHTDRNLYDRLRGLYEIPRVRLGTPERHQDILRRLQMTNDSRDLNDNPIRLFQTTSVTTVKPKWWMKVKMFFQNLLLYSDQVVGIAVIATIITFIVILVISKLLNAW